MNCYINWLFFFLSCIHECSIRYLYAVVIHTCTTMYIVHYISMAEASNRLPNTFSILRNIHAHNTAELPSSIEISSSSMPSSPLVTAYEEHHLRVTYNCNCGNESEVSQPPFWPVCWYLVKSFRSNKIENSTKGCSKLFIRLLLLRTDDEKLYVQM